MKPSIPLRHWAPLLGLLLLLGGCGFHLRGQAEALPAAVSPLYIAGFDSRDALYRALRHTLTANGVSLTEARAQAASILRIDQRRSTRQVMSVDKRNKVVEYELIESLRFELRDAAGEVLVPAQSLRALRIHLNPELETLSRLREAEILREDMRRELAQRLVQRLAAQLRHPR